jgi:catechol 2,3-dioxygenase-like lactoylglutathione lyase family enzyme
MTFHHVGLSTMDMDATKAFYEDVLGFTTVRYDRWGLEEGGEIRHIFLDTGEGSLLSFMEPKGIAQIPPFETSFYKTLGVPQGFVHFAFDAHTEEGLKKIRANLEAKGIKVTSVIDHDWCKSIYFNDPVNGLALEYAVYARAFNEDDRTLQYRFTAPLSVLMASEEGEKAVEKARREMLEQKKQQMQNA